MPNVPPFSQARETLANILPDDLWVEILLATLDQSPDKSGTAVGGLSVEPNG